MLNDENIKLPEFYTRINEASRKIEFSMPSDLKTGALLRSLSASKPGGRLLELGTGTGLSLSWMAEGADQNAVIISIDNSEKYQQIAKDIFEGDQRISLICTDALEWVNAYDGVKFDLIFADAWPGKFEGLEETLALLRPGGFYLIDDLLPQPNWWDGHQASVDHLVENLLQRSDVVQTTLNWSTGLMLFTKIR